MTEEIVARFFRTTFLKSQEIKLRPTVGKHPKSISIDI